MSENNGVAPRILDLAPSENGDPGEQLQLSPMETDIVAAVTDQWMRAPEIAEACHYPLSAQFRHILGNLVERYFLESSTHGYRRRSRHAPCVGNGQRSKQFSPTEEAIMSVVTDKWMTTVEISEACNISIGSQFRAILTNLVDCGILDSGSRGYRLLSGPSPCAGDGQRPSNTKPREHCGDTGERVLLLLAEVLAEGEPLHALIERGGMRAEITVRAVDALSAVDKADADLPATAPMRGKDFSPIERSILNAMIDFTEEWITRRELAGRCGQSLSTFFCSVLSNLADRDYLETSNKGFRLRCSPLPDVDSPLAASMGGDKFSPIEESIMRVVTKGWKTRQVIASECGQSKSSWLTYILSNLAERGYLESGRNGYRLRCSPSRSDLLPKQHQSNVDNEEDVEDEEDAEPLSGVERTVLLLLKTTKQKLSMGEIVGRFPSGEESDVRVAVQRLKQCGLIELDGGLYSAARK